MDEEGPHLEIRVRSLDGQQLQLKLPSHLRVAELKLRLQELDWPAPGVTQFHLFLRVGLLPPTHTIATKFRRINNLSTNPSQSGLQSGFRVLGFWDCTVELSLLFALKIE